MHRLELLSHYVTELEALDPKPGEAAELAEERTPHGQPRPAGRRDAPGGRAARRRRWRRDCGAGARADTSLRQLAAIDASLATTAGLVEEATIACREAVASLRRYMAALEADPARQEWVEARLAAIESAARKHRVEVAELSGAARAAPTELT